MTRPGPGPSDQEPPGAGSARDRIRRGGRLSLATTIAQAGANAAEVAWRAHLRICNQCHTARERKRPGLRCPDGQQAATDARNLRVIASREAELDRAPAAGQLTLDDVQ